MMTMFRRLYCLLIVFLLASCSVEKDQIIDTTFDVYVDRFFEEAQKRGQTIRKEDFSFTISFDKISYAGLCSRPGNDITISEFVWKDYNEMAREDLIFHEMGHCILKRPHDNGILAHGECKSIMKGTEDNRSCFRNKSSTVWRDYYLDELFNQDTPPPTWYVDSIQTVFSREVLTFEASVGSLLSKSITDFDPDENFEVLGTFTKNSGNIWIELIWGELSFIFMENSILISQGSETMYLNNNWSTFFETEFRFIQKEGFIYFLVDGEMFHIDEKRANPFSFIRVTTNADDIDVNEKIEVVLVVNELE